MLYIGKARSGSSDADVVADSPGEKHRLLADPGTTAQVWRRGAGGGDPPHGPGGRLAHAGDQRKQGRLADAGWPDDRRPAAGADRQVDPVQDRIVRVGKAE